MSTKKERWIPQLCAALADALADESTPPELYNLLVGVMDEICNQWPNRENPGERDALHAAHILPLALRNACEKK
jgi:hypothetical protein